MRLFAAQTLDATQIASTSGRPPAGQTLAAAPPAAAGWTRRQLPGRQHRQRLPPCGVTNEGREMRDPGVIKGSVVDDEEYITVDPDNPIPNPQLGALERRIGLPYEEALFADEVDPEAESYWFTEPAGGWRSEKKRLRKLVALDVPEEDDFRHYDGEEGAEGRTPVTEVREGAVIKGTVVAQLLHHGAQVDIGAEFDGLLPCQDVDMWDGVGDALCIGEQVDVRVYRVRDPRMYRFPVQLEAVDSALASRVVKPDEYKPPMDLRQMVVTPEELARETGREWDAETLALQTEEEFEYEQGMDLFKAKQQPARTSPAEQAAMDAEVERLMSSL